MTAGIGTFQTLFQTFYPTEELPYAIPRNLPLINMLRTADGLSGDLIDHPLLFGARQGYSQDFNIANAQRGTAPAAARASIRCSQAYSIFEVFDKDDELSQGDAAYADLFQKVMEGTLADFYNNLDIDYHVAGNGWRGLVGAVAGGVDALGGPVGTNQICLAVGLPLDAVFNPGQSLVATTYTGWPVVGSIFGPADGRAATTTSTPVQVVAIDSSRRLLTLTDASAFTTSSFVAAYGCTAGYSSTNLLGGIIGVDAWNPAGGVTSTDNLCGLNRSQYGSRLAGTYHNGTNQSIEDGIKRCSSKMAVVGASNSSLVALNPTDWDSLDSKLMTQYKYSSLDLGVYGFSSIVINGASGGRLDCVIDPHQPQGYGRIYDMDALLVRHKKPIPHLASVQGQTEYASENFDGRRAKLRAYLQLLAPKPWCLGIVKFPTIAS